MRNLIKALAVLSLLSFAPLQDARASLIVATFNGTLNYDFANFGATVGLSSGDKFAGSFAYDSVSGNPLYFAAAVDGQILVANNLYLYAIPFDGLYTWFAIRGVLSNGLYMSLGLGAGNGAPIPGFTSAPPSYLNSADWFQQTFVIRPASYLPIDTGCCGLPEIGAVYSNSPAHPTAPSNYFLTTFTVPEPTTLSLLGLGLVGVGFMRRRTLS